MIQLWDNGKFLPLATDRIGTSLSHVTFLLMLRLTHQHKEPIAHTLRLDISVIINKRYIKPLGPIHTDFISK